MTPAPTHGFITRSIPDCSKLKAVFFGSKEERDTFSVSFPSIYHSCFLMELAEDVHELRAEVQELLLRAQVREQREELLRELLPWSAVCSSEYQ